MHAAYERNPSGLDLLLVMLLWEAVKLRQVSGYDMYLCLHIKKI